MSFPRGTEVGIDPEMQLHTLNTEPHPAPTFQLGRLGNLDQAENTHVERAGRCLTARRHRELHVVERDETPRGISHLIVQGLGSRRYKIGRGRAGNERRSRPTKTAR